MPKKKSHSGTKDRVKLTKSGKVLMRKSNRNHNMKKKSAARKRTLSKMKNIQGNFKKNLKQSLGK